MSAERSVSKTLFLMAFLAGCLVGQALLAIYVVWMLNEATP